MKIAFIVQRYGTEILGGSEYHCRLIAERLAPRHQVEVLTTCAQDYITWENEYPEGPDRVRGVTVRRFANAQTRDIDAFNRYSEWIFNNAHTRDDEMEWLRQQGPWCPALLEYLERNHQQYDVLIFFTYLYAPTVLGIEDRAAQEHPGADGARRAGDPAGDLQGAVQPAGRHRLQHRGRAPLPDDALLDPRGRRGDGRLRRRPAAGAGSTRGSRRQATAGTRRGGDETPRTTLADASGRTWRSAGPIFRRRHRLHGPFVLYGGRIDPGKGCEELIEYFSTYVQEGGDASLVLMGVKLMPLPEEPFIRFAGRLSDQERTAGARSRHGRRRAVAVREPVAAGARVVRRRHAGPRQRAQRGAGRSLPARATPACTTPTATSSPSACKLLIADQRLRAAHGRQRPRLRPPELPLGRDPRQVREDVHEAEGPASLSADRASITGASPTRWKTP